jgi:DNA replication protein DnaC
MTLRHAWARGLDAPELAQRVDSAALERARGLDLATIDRVTLLGGAGSGKTSIAVALACEWAAHCGRVASWSLPWT